MKLVDVRFLVILLTGILFVPCFSSCGKKHSCYDQELYEKGLNGGCLTDCPGVKACNGKTYCNECEANRNGFRVD